MLISLSYSVLEKKCLKKDKKWNKRKILRYLQKIILIGMCLISIFFMAVFTYFTRIDAGYSVNDAFQAAFAVFITLLILGIFAFCFIFGIAELIEQKQKN